MALTGAIANSYSGGTYINAGTLIVNNDNQLGGRPEPRDHQSVVLRRGTLSLANGVSLNANRSLGHLGGNSTIAVAAGGRAQVLLAVSGGATP